MTMSSASPSRVKGQLAVVIAGGGTGGHLYPGLAVARELIRQRPEAVVTFAGTARGLEATVIPREGFALDLLRSVGIKGRTMGARLRGLGMLVPSALDAWRLLSKRRPSVVVGVGGYSSGPVVFLAALRRMPTLVLEQNAVPGLTNRLLARVVRAAAVNYDTTRPYFGERAFVAGNPVRREFFAIGDKPAGSGGPRVLVLGGSQGAHAINEAMVGAAPILAARVPGLSILHQTGARDLETVRTRYSEVGIDARAEAFLDPVVDAVRDADIVVCRAGATTLAELAAAGRTGVLIPFPAATDDHQRKNALVLANAQAAVLLDQRDLTPEVLAETLTRLLEDPNRLASMRRAVRAFARPDAAELIASKIQELAA
jgi:UDP-N-acetylglucosamine--N-acetylmuramyl-(pentapeptide) pyrophosphoryl-undecaprenol N-acetylglucosamine transferase